MKKFAYLLAALSLCACTFTGCSDDGDDEKASSAKKGESCAELQCEGDLVCNNESKLCEEKASEDGGNKTDEDPCKDKSAGDACGDKKVCDDNLKCVDDKSGEGDKVNCDDYPKTKAAIDEAVKANIDDCDAVGNAFQSLVKGLVDDKVASADDELEAALEKGGKILDACSDGWGMTKEKSDALNAKLASCAAEQPAEPDAACKGKKAGDECDEGKVCDEALKCVDKPAEGGDDIKCADYDANLKPVFQEMLKADICLDLWGSQMELALVAIDAKIASKEDTSKLESIVKKCSAEWASEAELTDFSTMELNCDEEKLCPTYKETQDAVDALIKLNKSECDDEFKAAYEKAVEAAVKEKAIPSNSDADNVPFVAMVCSNVWKIADEDGEKFSKVADSCEK